MAAVVLGDGHPQVADRRARRQLDVTMAFADAAANGEDRQRIAGVLVRVAHAAAIEDERVVEERTVAVRRVLQRVEELREELDVVRIDLHDFRDVRRVVAVVRDGVVLLADANLRIRPLAQLAIAHEREDARQIAAIRERQQVVHQRQMLVERVRHAGRQGDRRDGGAVARFGPLDATLDLAHILEIVAKPRAIAGAERSLKLLGLRRHEIEDAARPAQTTPGCARVRLLTTTSVSLYRSSGLRIDGSSNPVPAVFGIHCSTIAPFGTNTAPKRGVRGAADALNAGTIASRNGSATDAPRLRRRVRRGSDSCVRYIAVTSL